jgi:hypothetical protein
MTTNTGYIEQFKRVERSYQRLIEINIGKLDDYGSDFLFDDFLNFFMNCYHLKDWIKNDSTLSSSIKSSVETFINSSKYLSICGDIANGAKHLTLTSSRSNCEIKKGPTHYAVECGEITIISAKYTYLIDNNPVDAFVLATECLHEWKKFIKTI